MLAIAEANSFLKELNHVSDSFHTIKDMNYDQDTDGISIANLIGLSRMLLQY